MGEPVQATYSHCQVHSPCDPESEAKWSHGYRIIPEPTRTLGYAHLLPA